MKTYDSYSRIIKVSPPKKTDTWIIRFLIGCGLLSMIIFTVWFFDPVHIGFGPIYWLLTFALFFKLAIVLHEWYHYWSIDIPVPPQTKTKTKFTADILTTACPGEPYEMIVRTLRAMVAVRYPHTNYLCDEGNDPELRKICKELGVIHVTRQEKINAKAGNINNALKQATGDICVVLDPDHVPVPEFLDRVLPYFEDPSIGYVQCVQGYYNQSESFIAKGAAEQTYHFYGPMMMCMNRYGTVQAIGANCSFRREALDSIGGHAAGLAEDMHTAMQLHAKKWKSVYIPEMLTKGLVPATLSAYYKQQLKWSRGTFELLFRVYPKLFTQFTWRQKLHYLTVPLFFLFGLVSLIDLVIPALSLYSARVPWEIDLESFSLFFLPFCGLSLLIRIFAQRWLIQKEERGLHLTGGVLLTGTWWIFLVGFIYSIFKIKVPYIPTPKEEDRQNCWTLSIPNIVMVGLCTFAIFYGLAIDWTPYSLAMALFALLNAVMLGIIVLVSQQKLFSDVKEKMKKVKIIRPILIPLTIPINRGRRGIYSMIRNGPVAVLIASALLVASFTAATDNTTGTTTVNEKSHGGFYLGVSLKESNDLTGKQHFEKILKTKLDVVSISDYFAEDEHSSAKELNLIREQNGIPLINWEVRTTDEKLKICEEIYKGKHRNYLEHYAERLRQYSDPVFINFAPHFDDPENPNSLLKNNSAEDFQRAWQYLYTFFNNLGVSNITWIWNPRTASPEWYPGPDFVDWVGVSCLNYADGRNDDDWYSFADIYNSKRTALSSFKKPVIVTEFGTAAGSAQLSWTKQAMTDIQEKFTEIRALVFYSKEKHLLLNSGTGIESSYTADFSLRLPENIHSLTKKFSEEPFSKKPLQESKFSFLEEADKNYRSDLVTGKPGNYQLLINGKPFYLRGVAFNTEHDWRDGHMPLTRRQLEKDFQRIKDMGANVIRRYDPGIYDRNILNIANEYDLKVLYGFWFDPEVDYYKDTQRVQEYIANVEKTVSRYKDYSSVLGWSLGNETWGLLKHRYAKPYLSKVRQHYIKMIETIAQRLHALDPERPVFSCMEHEDTQIAGELVAFRDGAPSVDVMGINSYYREQITKLNHVTWQFDSLRPYLVSEFGPRGYWNPRYNKIAGTKALEETEEEKSKWYCEQWNDYILANKGYNVGGIAFCWHDRMEGSFTWFGLTDYQGRTKAPYHALKQVWTKRKSISLPVFSINGPAEVIPGHEYVFKKECTASVSPQLTYEWHLLKEHNMEIVETITSADKSHSAKLRVPEDRSDYRLYLYVSDEDGNVSTSSFSLNIKK
jgi:cellulose synthase (UDP-forming)